MKYDSEFFAEQIALTGRSAAIVVDVLLNRFPSRSVIDVGCGAGIWLREFARAGIDDFLGVDGSYLERELLQIPAEKFIAYDLLKPLQIGRKFDIAISLEVAEHLPSHAAARFVRDLTSLSQVVVFSAAVPGQGGVNHVNEQWPEYWAAQFDECGYQAIDSIRWQIWNDDKVLWYYRQNLLIYIDRQYLSQHSELFTKSPLHQGPLNVVHPGMYGGLMEHTDPQRTSVVVACKRFTETLKAALERRLSRQIWKQKAVSSNHDK